MILLDTLNQAWLARWNQRLEPAMRGLAAAQVASGWATLSPDSIIPREEWPLFQEAVLLKASLLRAQGQRKKASSLLRKVQAKTDALAEPRSFRLLFELGLDHWIDNQTASALEYFLMAEHKGRSAEEKLFALSNVLWCLEAMDISRGEVEAKLSHLLQEDSENIQHVKEQWQAYQMRKAFYASGKIEAACEASSRGQPTFFQAWAKALPYGKAEALGLASDVAYLWQGRYRARTLAGIWAPGDRQPVRSGDAIDRLYLWVWHWLTGRPGITEEKVLFTLESVLETVELETESKENLLLFRNSLEWILLLEPSLAARFRAILKALRRVQSQSYPLLEAEHFLIQRLAPASEDSDLDPMIGQHPAFARILAELRAGKKDGLLPLLNQRLGPYQEKSGAYDLVVDSRKGEIQAIREERIYRSQGLVQLFTSLAQFPSVARGDFSRPKQGERWLGNLISRARKIAGPQAILARGSTLQRGPAWPKVLLLHPSAAPIFTPLDPPTALAANAMVGSDAYLQAARALLPSHFDRRDLERKLQVSKATASRMVDRWACEELLIREGKAKATSYRWKEKSL
jgi:hypothetical protein